MKSALPTGKAFLFGSPPGSVLEIPGEVGDQPAGIALEVEDLVQGSASAHSPPQLGQGRAFSSAALRPPTR